MVPRETENNCYAKFWGDKQRALWYVILFSVVVNSVNIALVAFPFGNQVWSHSHSQI